MKNDYMGAAFYVLMGCFCIYQLFSRSTSLGAYALSPFIGVFFLGISIALFLPNLKGMMKPSNKYSQEDVMMLDKIEHGKLSYAPYAVALCFALLMIFLGARLAPYIDSQAITESMSLQSIALLFISFFVGVRAASPSDSQKNAPDVWWYVNALKVSALNLAACFALFLLVVVAIGAAAPGSAPAFSASFGLAYFALALFSLFSSQLDGEMQKLISGL
ncbi:MAG: hypothetical protein WCY41_04050 [Candidatus Micrarchaeia archaeon]